MHQYTEDIPQDENLQSLPPKRSCCKITNYKHLLGKRKPLPDAKEESSRTSTSGEMETLSTGVGKRRAGSKRSKTAATSSSSRPIDIGIVETGGMGMSHNRSLSNQNETSNVTFNTLLLSNNGDKPNTSQKKSSRTTKKGKKAGPKSKRKPKRRISGGSKNKEAIDKSDAPLRKTRKMRSQSNTAEDVTSEANHEAEPKEIHEAEPGVDHEDASEVPPENVFEVDHATAPEVDHATAPEVDHATAPEVDHATAPEVDHSTAPEVDHATAPEVDHSTAPEVDHATAPEVDQVAEPKTEHDTNSAEEHDTNFTEEHQTYVVEVVQMSDDSTADHYSAEQTYHEDPPEVDHGAELEADHDTATLTNHKDQEEVEHWWITAPEVNHATEAKVDHATEAEVGHVDAPESAQDTEQHIFAKPKATPKRRYRKKETPQKPTLTPNSLKNDLPKTDSETPTPQRRSQRASFGVHKKRTAMEEAELNNSEEKVPRKKNKVAKSKQPPEPREKKQKVTEKKKQDSVKSVAEKKGKKRKSEEKVKEEELEEEKEDSSGGESDSSSDFDYMDFGGQEKYQEWVKRKSYRPNTFTFENEPLVLRNDTTYYALISNDAQLKLDLNQLNRMDVILASKEDEFKKDPQDVWEKLKSGERKVLPIIDISTKPLEVNFDEALPVVTGKYIEEYASDGYDTGSETEEATQSNGQANGKRAQIWTSLEQKKFEELMVKYPFTGNSMERSRQIAIKLGTRTAEQVRSHMQNNMIRLQREGIDVPGYSRRYKRYQHPPKRAHNNPHSSSSTALRRLAQQQHNNNHEQPTTSSTTASGPLPEYDSDSDNIVYPEDIQRLLADPSNVPLMEEWKELYKQKQRILKKAETDAGKGAHEGFTCITCNTTPITGIRYECKHCREMQGNRLSLCGSCMKMSEDGMIKISYYEHQQWHLFDYVKPGYIIPETSYHKVYCRKIIDKSWVPNDPNYA